MQAACPLPLSSAAYFSSPVSACAPLVTLDAPTRNAIGLQAWVEAVDEEHITKGVQTGRPQRFALCERHFTDTCFTSTLKTFLNKYAVPNVDVKNPGHNEQLLQAADSWYRKMQLAKMRPDTIRTNQQEVSEETPDPKEPVQSENWLNQS
ncbi:uncharacterized protein ISCGN_008056 [Ixodes scapularis]